MESLLKMLRQLQVPPGVSPPINKGPIYQGGAVHPQHVPNHVASQVNAAASRRSLHIPKNRAPSPSHGGIMMGGAAAFHNGIQASHSFTRNSDTLSMGSMEYMSQYVENGYRAEGEIPQQSSRQYGDASAIELRARYSHNGYRPDGEAPPQQRQHGDVSTNPTPPGGISVIPQSYVMHQELGSGGAGKAFLVHGKSDGKRYVAKQIVCLGEKYKAASASYALHETRLLFLLQHPHIVELRDFYPKSANYFIIMEFCENGDLAHHIENASRRGVKFDTERIFTWWYQMLDGTDYCHSKGVIHRDLKPRCSTMKIDFMNFTDQSCWDELCYHRIHVHKSEYYHCFIHRALCHVPLHDQQIT
jgi:hypothetical protein